MLLCLQNIVIPLDGDDAAIKKYAQQVEALKQKVRSDRAVRVQSSVRQGTAG